MKIAYVITRADAVGGASVHVRDLSRALLDRGHDVRVFVGGDGPVTQEFSRLQIPYSVLRYMQRAVNPLADLRAFREMQRTLRKFAPDVVSTHTAKAGWIGRAACRRLGLPVIYTAHGWSISERISRLHGAIYAAVERVAAKWSDAIICVSEQERDLALAKRIAPPQLLHVVHNGVQDIGPELRARPGARPVRFVSVARFEAPKDHATLLAAFAEARELEWELDLVGDGPLMPETRALAKRLGIAGRVRFLGYQADPAQVLSRAQCFVLSSRFEGFPRSILEAMRAGLPVLASDVGGVPEAVVDGETGYLVPPGSTAILAGRIKCLINDDSDRERLGVVGHQLYEMRFGFSRMLAATETIYATVLGNHPYR